MAGRLRTCNCNTWECLTSSQIFPPGRTCMCRYIWKYRKYKYSKKKKPQTKEEYSQSILDELGK
jgi:hypothetical protein